MQIRQKKKKSKKNVVIVVSLVLLIIIAGCLLWFNRDKIGWSGDNSEDSDTVNNTPDDSGAVMDKSNPEKSPIEQNWMSDDGAPNDLEVSVTHNDVVDRVLVLRVQINKYLSGGTCRLEIGSYSETVDIVPDPQASSCMGFDVPTSKFSGNNFTITVNSGDENGSVKGTVQ